MKESTLRPRPTHHGYIGSRVAVATVAALLMSTVAACSTEARVETPRASTSAPTPATASLPLGVDPRAVVACAEHVKELTGDLDSAYEDCLDEAVNVLSAIAFNDKYDELISADDPSYVARPLPARTATTGPDTSQVPPTTIEVTMGGTGAQFTWSTEDGSIHQTSGDGPVIFTLPNRQGVLVNASVFAYTDANATCSATADGAVVVENVQNGQTYASCTFALPYPGQ